jgi:fimbrial chaperone protein
MAKFRKLAGAILLVLFGGMHAVSSATVMSPVRLTVQEKSRATSLQMTNDGKHQMSIDVRVMDWLDVAEDGGDVLEPSEAIISSRPVLTIEPGQTVIVRFLVSKRSDKAQDNYRVILNDITPNVSGKIAVRVRQILPLFVVNKMEAKGKLEMANGALTNVGDRHVRITAYRDIEGKKVDTLRYVLPGKSVKLPVFSIDDVTYNDNLY